METCYRLHWTELRDTYLLKNRFNITSLEKNVTMSPARPRSSNDCPGEVQQKCTRPEPTPPYYLLTASCSRVVNIPASYGDFDSRPETGYPIVVPAQQANLKHATTTPLHILPS
jgi:hypothetical protein